MQQVGRQMTKIVSIRRLRDLYRERRTFRFCLNFIMLMTCFYLLYKFPLFTEKVETPFTEKLVRLSSSLLNLWGSDTKAEGMILHSEDCSVNIMNGCNGVFVIFMCLAAVFAFPARVKQKAIGLSIVIPTVFLVNLARVVLLFWIASNYSEHLGLSHTYIGQAMVITISFMSWLFWVERFAEEKDN